MLGLSSTLHSCLWINTWKTVYKLKIKTWKKNLKKGFSSVISPISPINPITPINPINPVSLGKWISYLGKYRQTGQKYKLMFFLQFLIQTDPEDPFFNRMPHRSTER